MNYWEELQRDLEKEPDLEEKIDLLRRFTRSRTKEIQARDQGLPLLSLFEELTALAEAVLRGSHEISKAELERSHPGGRGPFAIIAMGKFGGRELTYRSDLDIIYLFERPEDQEFLTRLGQRIITALTVVTREGYAYRIDTALRPSGQGGTLVSSLQAFREYHRETARTWERQSLIKARPVLGEAPFRREIEDSFHSIAYQTYDPRTVASDIRTLRARMERELAREKPGTYNLKTGRGGIIDIEFLVQYLQLTNGQANPSLRSPNTIEALRSLARESLLTPTEAQTLEEAYLFYREIETRLRLLLERPVDELVEGSEGLTTLEKQFFKGRSVIKDYLLRREEVRTLYEKVLNP